MGWNILADCLAKQENTEPQYIDWSHRCPLILNRLKAEDADFICLQEVDHYGDVLEPFLNKLGYLGVNCRRKVDDVAIFWKRNKFLLVKKEDKKLAGEYGVSKNYVQCAIFAHFQSIEHPENEFVLVVTHLKAGIGYYPVRISQAAMMMDHLKIFTEENPNIPAVLVGDFNDFPSGDVYKFLLNGNVSTKFSGSRRSSTFSCFLQYLLSKKFWEMSLLTFLMGLILYMFFTFSTTSIVISFTPLLLYVYGRMMKMCYYYKKKQFKHSFQLRSAYSHYKDLKTNQNSLKGNYFLLNAFIPPQQLVDGPYTCYIKKLCFHWKVTIDYIWYTSNHLQVTHLMKMPEENELVDYLPSKHYPSDHLPIRAQFKFLPQDTQQQIK
uniref:Endonuclease/exonuclease/phosphatase domain-containing protein n=1 Tax=Arcella intermedia TaxID=1963864 RepID=A0A6B2L710_9EUKA